MTDSIHLPDPGNDSSDRGREDRFPDRRDHSVNWASPFPSRLATADSRIEFTCVTDWPFTSSGFPPRLAATQERYYQVHYNRLPDSAQVWNEIAQATAEVKADENRMSRLKAEITERP